MPLSPNGEPRGDDDPAAGETLSPKLTDKQIREREEHALKEKVGDPTICVFPSDDDILVSDAETEGYGDDIVFQHQRWYLQSEADGLVP